MSNVELARQFFLQGLAFFQDQDFPEAESRFQKAADLAPDRVSVLTNLAATRIKLQKFDLAMHAAQQALALDATNVEALIVLGLVDKERHNFEQAAERFDAALRLSPDSVEAWLNKGVVAHTQKRYEQALEHYDHVVRLRPDYPEGWLNRGNTLLELERFDEALAHFQRALALDSGLMLAIQGIMKCHKRRNDNRRLIEAFDAWQPLTGVNAYANELMGYAFLDQGDKDQAYAYFRKASVIAETQRDANNQTEWPIQGSRIRHDLEQLEHLEALGKITDSGRRSLAVLKRAVNNTTAPVDSAEKEALLYAASHYHHVPDFPFAGKALGDNDYPAIEHAFFHNALRLVVIDDFLTETALLNMRRYCEEASVWKRSYHSGYVGTFMGTGFCSRVLLAIADELKRAMPKVIGSNSLSEAWAFKYDQNMSGVNLHADFASINTNFWITPDGACLDNSKGGLLIYDVPAPNDWSFYAYNSDSRNIERFLKQHNSKFTRVPYKANRCVLFDSTYFHATDEISFKPEYQNRRVNCTLLYGKAL